MIENLRFSKKNSKILKRTFDSFNFFSYDEISFQTNILSVLEEKFQNLNEFMIMFDDNKYGLKKQIYELLERESDELKEEFIIFLIKTLENKQKEVDDVCDNNINSLFGKNYFTTITIYEKPTE